MFDQRLLQDIPNADCNWALWCIVCASYAIKAANNVSQKVISEENFSHDLSTMYLIIRTNTLGLNDK